MSHAQVNANPSSAVTTPAAPTSTPNSSPTSAPTTSSQGAALNTILNSAAPASPALVPTPIPVPVPITGKYEEYQSICRSNEYDILAFYSEQLKEQRITLIKNHILKSPTTVSYSLRLLKELADQKKLKELQVAMTELKSKKLSGSEQNMADAILAFAKKDKKGARDRLNSVLKENSKNIEALKLLA